MGKRGSRRRYRRFEQDVRKTEGRDSFAKVKGTHEDKKEGRSKSRESRYVINHGGEVENESRWVRYVAQPENREPRSREHQSRW